MAWERRQRGGLYYTRTRRINGRQIREYYGGGLLGRLAEAQAEEEQCQREQERVRWLKTKTEIAARESPLNDLDEACNQVIHASLKAAGYYYYRGEWRKRHD